MGGQYVTGVYAPPGEVIKITISKEDLEAIGSAEITIGQIFSNKKANSIPVERDFVRMPIIANKFPLDQETIYVGSHLGGPIYIGYPTNTENTFSVTISGGVRYPHYIQGYTTKEEWEDNVASSAPYIDIEVWDDSLRFSGSRYNTDYFTYDDINRTYIQ